MFWLHNSSFYNYVFALIGKSNHKCSYIDVELHNNQVTADNGK